MYYNNQNTGNKTDYGDVSAEEAAELIKTKPSLIILDVRTETEFNEERIEHSINYPVDELEQRINELDNTDEILVYCTKISLIAADGLTSLIFPEITTNLRIRRIIFRQKIR